MLPPAFGARRADTSWRSMSREVRRLSRSSGRIRRPQPVYVRSESLAFIVRRDGGLEPRVQRQHSKVSPVVIRRDPARTLAAWAFAVVLVGVSYFSYASQFNAGSRWQASNFDPADYRILAEHFWHVQTPASTYDVDEEWQAFLRRIPFRGIGLGTLYLLVGILRTGHAPSTPEDILATGVALAMLEKILLAAALLLLFEVVRRSWGTLSAVVAITATALPPRFWRLSDDFLAEPVLRVCFLLLLASAIVIGRRKSTALAFGMMLLILFAAHLKADWALAGLLLLPVLLLSPPVSLASVRLKAALAVAALLIPLSIVAVNWIGWGLSSPRPGVALHVNLKYGEELARSFCAQPQQGDRSSPFCDSERPRRFWWNVYIGRDLTPQYMAAFDAYARRDLLTHPGRDVREFWAGLGLASSVPGTTSRLGAGFRVVPIPEPWHTIVQWMDRAVWILLIVGLASSETRLACGVALVLWIVPAVGNIVSLYELRYHMPMAGVAATCAFGVLILRVRGRLGSSQPQSA
jgi:hypothetical protein